MAKKRAAIRGKSARALTIAPPLRGVTDRAASVEVPSAPTSPAREWSVSKTQFDEILDFTRRLYGRVSMHGLRSHSAIRMFVAALGLAVREARRDPVAANAACRKAGAKGKRLEVRITRLITRGGHRVPKGVDAPEQDQTPRW